MPTSPLHGLNLVHADSGSAADNTSQADLNALSAHNYQDLAAQLDLWSTLNFQSDERSGGNGSPRGEDKDDDEGEGDADSAERPGPASLESHVNAVNPSPTNTPIPSKPNVNSAAQLAFPPFLQQQHQHGQPGPVDMNAILASFGIDPFLVPQITPPAPSAQSAASHSLAQLLAAYPFAHPPFLPPAHLQDQQQQQQNVAPSALTAIPTSTSDVSGQDAKKARSRKVSISISKSAADAALDSEPPSPTSATSSLPTPSSIHSQGLGLNATEDKRRRNTAASARFRMKKKEREAALERRAAELESRVGALERECEGLRRENGWLKGLVVGVTGASQGTVVSTAQSPVQAQAQAIGSGKRKREEEVVA